MWDSWRKELEVLLTTLLESNRKENITPNPVPCIVRDVCQVVYYFTAFSVLIHQA